MSNGLQRLKDSIGTDLSLLKRSWSDLDVCNGNGNGKTMVTRSDPMQKKERTMRCSYRWEHSADGGVICPGLRLFVMPCREKRRPWLIQTEAWRLTLACISTTLSVDENDTGVEETHLLDSALVHLLQEIVNHPLEVWPQEDRDDNGHHGKRNDPEATRPHEVSKTHLAQERKNSYTTTEWPSWTDHMKSKFIPWMIGKQQWQKR